jgi:hypothetical protein
VKAPAVQSSMLKSFVESSNISWLASANQWSLERGIVLNSRTEVKASTRPLQSRQSDGMASSLAMSPLGYRIEGKSGGLTVFISYFVGSISSEERRTVVASVRRPQGLVRWQ